MGMWDRSGSVSIANGATALTGILTTFNVSARPGDAIYINGGSKPYEILTVNSNTSITLNETFTETTVVAGTFKIPPYSYQHVIASDVLARLDQVLLSQTDLFETSGPPSASLGSDKSVAIDPVARVYYYKTGGAWGSAVPLGGADGADVGFKSLFSTSTAMSDPGTGGIRFNNATRASVTAIAIDDLSADTGNPDVSEYIKTWDDSTNTVRGTLILRKVGAPQNFAIFAVTGASVDNTGWKQLAVTHVASGGTFVASDVLTAAFLRAGDRGTAGVDGVSAGPLFALSTNTAMADPGPGTVRFNNATLSLATAMAIDAMSAAAGNPSLASFINTWDDSSNTAHRGTLTFTKLGAQQNFAIFAIAGVVVDNTGWHQITITYVNGAGTLANGDTLVVQFDRTGNAGADGVSTGFDFTFASSNVMGDPGAGLLRLNNATLASVTAIAINDASADAGNPDISAAILAWDDSTNLTHRGILTIRKKSAKQNLVQYSISGASVDNTGWTQLAVTHIASAGSFSNTDAVVIDFARTGNVGAAGADGSGSVSTVNGVSPSLGNVVVSASDIAAASTPTNYGIAGNSVNDHFIGINTALGNAASYVETTIASAATVDIGASATTSVYITGTTNITSLGSADGKLRIIRFASSLTLANNAAIILAGGLNVQTYNGLTMLVKGEPSGVWREVARNAKRGMTVQTFTGNGTWTKPDGCVRVRYRATAGGGGGAGTANASASQVAYGTSGGGGGYAEGWLDVTAIASVAVTVGALGAKGASGANNGTAGGSSSFGTYGVAAGGAAGQTAASGTSVVQSNGAAGGTVSAGTLQIPGEQGGPFIRLSGTSAFMLSNGGNSGHGMGTGGGAPAFNANGNPGTGYGAGGSGCASSNAGGAFAGGDGSAGYVIVEEFY